MTTSILLCTDLDRTLIPNGEQEESANARPLFRRFARRPEVKLAYVSGRHLEIIKEAISQYDLPTPDFAIGDVGTTIYHIANGEWKADHRWQEKIAADWNGKTGGDLASLLGHFKEIRPQEEAKQNRYKLSYYAATDCAVDTLLGEIDACLKKANVRANLIWSIDEEKDSGLLDIVPKSANKESAIRHLMDTEHFTETNTLFAGDSGNDLDPLTSGLQAILVRNAHPDVRQQAIERCQLRGHPERLYTAKGGFLGMNGNYAAGILEGAAHFKPEIKAWLESP